MTFIECPNDISAMIDLSKIADIALTMIDSSVGFEMETFEFLSLLKNHGFTSVMGVLTNMDKFRINKSLNKLKKQIKKRFLKEATDKAKLFYLFGIKNGLYVKMQMHNLARYLKVIKPNEIGFRQNHPYIFADRFDITFANSASNDPEDDVMVSFFGYVRGNNFNKNSTVHINGLGDYNVDFVNKNDDPCPVETVEIKGKKKRTLKQKEKTLYAPYCNVNSLEYDRNSGYINIPDRFVTFTKGIKEDSNIQLDEGVRMVRELQNIKTGVIDRQIDKDESFEIFEGVDFKNEKSSVSSGEEEEDEEEENNFNANDSESENFNVKKYKPTQKNKNQNNLHHITNLGNDFEFKSEPLYYQENPTDDITKIIYEASTNDEDEDNNIEDCYKYNSNPEFNLDFYIKKAKKRFITGSSIFETEGNEEMSDVDEEKDE
jgi:ribosome biogenesis protein BMS1